MSRPHAQALFLLFALNYFEAVLYLQSFCSSIHFAKKQDIALHCIRHIEMVLIKAFLEFLQRTDTKQFGSGPFAVFTLLQSFRASGASDVTN